MPRLLIFLLSVFVLVGCAREEGEPAPAQSVAFAEDDVTIERVTADDLLREVRAAGADLVVVNFWASWCAPCREEFPEFMEYGREHGDVDVRFVSIDFEDDLPHAVAFLREQNFRGTTYLKTGRDAPFIDAVHENWTGALPATAVYDRNGTRLAFWEGKVTYDQLAARVEDARRSL